MKFQIDKFFSSGSSQQTITKLAVGKNFSFPEFTDNRKYVISGGER